MKRWLIETYCGVPYEMYELLRDPTAWRNSGLTGFLSDLVQHKTKPLHFYADYNAIKIRGSIREAGEYKIIYHAGPDWFGWRHCAVKKIRQYTGA